MKTESLLRDEKETDTLRKSGIEVVGNIPWGTHLCQFYDTKDDLIDILVPYFAEGLRNNEFCMWVASPPLGVEEAGAALQKAVPDLERYIKKGQIEILLHTDWYLLGGEFDAYRVLDGWVQKEKDALDRGFAGLRLTGNTFWVKRDCWKHFVDYEATVNDVIGEHRIIAICTYSLEKCTGNDVVDVMRNHESALIRKGKTWILAEDVFKRRSLEKKVAHAHAKLETLLETAMEGIAVVDPKENLTFLNKAFADMLGYRKDELLGMNLRKFVSKEDFLKIQRQTEIRKGRKPSRYELVLYGKDGKPRHVLLSAAPLWNSDGGFAGSIAIAMDVTERKRAEEKIRKEKDFTLSLLKGLKEGFAVVDQEGKQILVNDELCKMTGYSEKELLSQKPPFKYWAEEDLKDINEAFEKTLRGVEGEYELIFKRKDGERFIALVSPRKTVDSDGNTIFFATIKDITERKRAEEALRESEEKFRNIFESANDGMIYLDSSGIILDVNEKAVEVFGGSRKELLGKHFTRLGEISPKYMPTLISNFAKTLAGKKTHIDICIKNKKGKEIHLESSASLLKIDGKPAAVLCIARDITERKKAEKALRESEQKLRDIIDTSPDAIVWVDTTGKITLVNKKGFELTGFSEKELIGKNFMDVEALTQESKEKIMEGFMKRLEGIDTPPYEVEIVTKNGEVIPAEISASPIFEGGKIVGTQSIFRDLRERKRAEERLRESEERFRNLYESIQDPVGVFVGREGRLIDYNKAFKKLAGYTDEELKDKAFLDFVHPDDHALVLEKYRTKYPEEELPLVYEIRAVNKKGETIPLEISVSTYKTKGKVVGVEVIHRDITKRKEMEKKLKEYAEHLEEMVEKRTKALVDSEKKYRVLYETIRDGISTADMDGHIVECNQAYADMLGYSKDELKNLTYQQLTPKQWHQMEAKIIKEQVLKRGYSDEYEKEYIRKDGTVFPVSIRVGLIRSEDGKPERMWGIVRDITERKQMEAQLLKTERLAAIGELATMVGHDLRNPLTSLQNASYYLKMKLGSSKDEKIKKMFEIIDKEINYANKIVNDLLDFSRLKKPELKKVDIISSIQDALAQLKFPESITLTTKFSKVPAIEADPDQLRRVFQNIALNGMQAMPNGGKLIVSTRKNGDFVEATFRDTGVGIPEENMGKLFTPLFTTKAQGVGLGLSICKNLVEAHNGRIEVKSKVGEGSTFTVKLPIHQTRGGEKQT